ncbi:metallophosphoesterase family protein [Rossellomorea aquimaris]|uniref:metallophosphoesterase n=1 Tax=Rossellomorea aquimaris TaxID=189382 RepID=UPI001CD2B6F2|nr:metallophosphoesterase family protein [Rossellomorea aquimaris]MCA1054671.1 metallophosphoesterase family protein [Rossellomorea aquimaris]
MLELIIILVLSGGALVLLFMYLEAHRNEVKTHTFSFPHFPSTKPLTIFFISDIHKRKIHNEIIERAQKADIVVIGGDLTEKTVPMSRVEENIEKLTGIGSVYFIWGNNDYEVNTEELKGLLLKMGVKEIVNDSVPYDFEGGRINLVGVDDASTQRAVLPHALRKIDSSSFNILLSHDPRLVKLVKSEDGIDLMLSGHTHGGQIRILGWGLYKKGRVEKRPETTLLVSNGYGTTALPLRLGAPPETHLITIKRG